MSIFNTSVSGGGGSTSFTITNNSSYTFPSIGEVGTFIQSSEVGLKPMPLSAKTETGRNIPMDTEMDTSNVQRWVFVMPSENIIVQ